MPSDINEATYTGNPADVPRDALRLLIGDTDVPEKARFSDVELDYFLAQAGSDPQAAAESAIAILQVSAAATAGTRTIGKTTVTDNRGQAYKEALAAVRSTNPAAASGTAVALFDVPGTTPAIFDYGMMDAPGTLLPGNPHDDNNPLNL